MAKVGRGQCGTVLTQSSTEEMSRGKPLRGNGDDFLLLVAVLSVVEGRHTGEYQISWRKSETAGVKRVG